MARIVLECAHADTCLPDYWGGHHMAHIAVPVTRDTTMPELRKALLSELAEGAVGGSDDLAFLLSADFVGPDREKDAIAATSAAYAAVRRIRIKKGSRRPFPELEPEEDDADYSVYAYFVLRKKED